MEPSTARSTRSLKHQDTALGQDEFVTTDFDAQTVVDPSNSAFGFLERMRADDLAGRLVRNAQHHIPATFIAKGNAVVHQLLEMEIRLRLLELDVLVL